MHANDPDISKVFERLLSLSASERRRELDEIAQYDPERAAELEGLLAAHDAAPGFLDHLDAEQAARLVEEDQPRLKSKRIGGYQTMGPDSILPRYRNLHLWMLLPFAITLLGFAPRYFLALPQATFHQHVHGISATLWFLLIIIQPWLITRGGHRATHRSLGIFGLVLAGMAAGSALAIIPRNIANLDGLPPGGIFTPTFAYFVTYLDTMLIGLFVFSVTLAILKIRQGQVANHVQWLLASVFFILSPALLRLILALAITMNSGEIDGISFMDMILPSTILMLVMIVVYYYRFGSFRHPSFMLLMLTLASFLLAEWVGDNEALRGLAHVIFKP